MLNFIYRQAIRYCSWVKPYSNELRGYTNNTVWNEELHPGKHRVRRFWPLVQGTGNGKYLKWYLSGFRNTCIIWAYFSKETTACFNRAKCGLKIFNIPVSLTKPSTRKYFQLLSSFLLLEILMHE